MDAMDPTMGQARVGLGRKPLTQDPSSYYPVDTTVI